MAKTLHSWCRGPRFDPWSATRSHVPQLKAPARCNEERATAKTQHNQINDLFIYLFFKNSGDKISWEFFGFF